MTTILILTSAAILSVAAALFLARKTSKEAEADEAIRIHDASKQRKERMEAYNAPVPTKDVPPEWTFAKGLGKDKIFPPGW